MSNMLALSEFTGAAPTQQFGSKSATLAAKARDRILEAAHSVSSRQFAKVLEYCDLRVYAEMHH